MRSLRSAAALLAAANSVDALTPILTALGFAGAWPFDSRSLGLTVPCTSVHVARGPGARRALVIVTESQTVQETTTRAAAQLARRAPHLLWLLIVIDGTGSGLAIATWAADRLPPRVAALVVDRARVVDSDADTLCALEAVAALGDETDGTLTHARWLDVLGRFGVDRRFFRTIERTIDTLATGAVGDVSVADRSEIALLYTCRILFLAFLESKGWLDGDRAFLARAFGDCVAGPGDVHTRVLRPLFFGTLNTPAHRRAARARAFGRVPFLNGGLFTLAPVERRGRDVRFPDEALAALFGDLLPHYRFTAREAGGEWSEAAVDPAMLGKTFESLMAAGERRGTGAYYTPRTLVEAATARTLGHLLDAPAFVRGDPLDGDEAARVRARLDAVRILDPACGSGAFLVHALECIAEMRARLGDARPTAEVRRAVLARSIFGVDINPTAVWLCELRLWLSVVIESAETDPMGVVPLPNLDRNVRVGDSLADDDMAPHPPSAPIAALRRRYTVATGHRKQRVRSALDRAERAVAVERLQAAIARVARRRRDLLGAVRGRDLFGEHRDTLGTERRALRRQARALRREMRALREGAALPFSYGVQFADVADGFDAIIGNPPWVRLHNIPPATRERLRGGFRTFREAAWRDGARLARAGSAFAAQVDLAALFVERALALSRPGGVTALLVPAKLFRALAGGGMRAMLLRETTVLALDDWSDAEPEFDAAVYPALIVARRRGEATPDTDTEIAVHRRGGPPRRWSTDIAGVPFDGSPGSPWVLVPPGARSAFDAITAAGVPLAATRMGAPLLGVKSGCNAAFVVTVDTDDGRLAAVHGRGEDGGSRSGTIERAMLRPLVRGDTLTPWTAPSGVSPGRECIIWTHRGSGALPALPEHAARWLAPWRPRLRERSDARGGGRWWSLFRTESAVTHRPRVVWGDVARTPRAAVLPAGSPCVALNSCYVVRCPELGDALALAVLLNGPLAAAYLNAIAEPARGLFRRYLGWTVALLPLPRDWLRARRRLAPIGERALGGETIAWDVLWDAAIDAYQLRAATVAPLAAWVLGPGR